MSARAPAPAQHLSAEACELWNTIAEAIGDGWHPSMLPHLEAAVRSSCGISEWCRARSASGELVTPDHEVDRYSELLREQGAALAALGVDGGEGASKH